jgi:hypothetical protein
MLRTSRSTLEADLRRVTALLTAHAEGHQRDLTHIRELEYDGPRRVSYASYSNSEYVPSRSLQVSKAPISSLFKPTLYDLEVHLPNSDNTGGPEGIVSVVY